MSNEFLKIKYDVISGKYGFFEVLKMVGKGGFEPHSPILKPLLNKVESNYTFSKRTVNGRSYFTANIFLLCRNL